ncbi:MAG: GNAT family N-acetyltransferase [Ferruginibacter sp.]|nr:GNAT family N-acetyltransferase [Ferruginibacter sp.]
MIRLEHFQERDFKQLIEWIHDEEILTNWSGSLFSYPLSAKSLAWYIKDTNILNDSDAYVYNATDDEGKSVGHISLGGISWKNRSARISRVLIGNTNERGKGCCQGMIKALLKIAFEELNLHRVSLGVYHNNTPATKCYEKTGFITEGIHRDILWYKDAWWSMVEMSILQQEWQTLNGITGREFK